MDGGYAGLRFDSVPLLPSNEDQVLRKSIIVPFATTESPSIPASAAGFTYAAVASSCPATTDPAIERSRAFVLGTAYPPANAAAGARRRAATKRFRMVVSITSRRSRGARWGQGAQLDWQGSLQRSLARPAIARRWPHHLLRSDRGRGGTRAQLPLN